MRQERKREREREREREIVTAIAEVHLHRRRLHYHRYTLYTFFYILYTIYQQSNTIYIAVAPGSKTCDSAGGRVGGFQFAAGRRQAAFNNFLMGGGLPVRTQRLPLIPADGSFLPRPLILHRSCHGICVPSSLIPLAIAIKSNHKSKFWLYLEP